MILIIIFIIIYFIIAFIFGSICYDSFIGVTDEAWILGFLWILVVPFMIIYSLLNTIVNWFQRYWR